MKSILAHFKREKYHCKNFSSLMIVICSKTRTSWPDVFCNKGILKNFAKFTGKELCQGFFFNIVADLSSFKNTNFYKTPPAAASGKTSLQI